MNAGPPRVLFLSHAAERTGPPLVLLEVQRWFRAHTDIEVGNAFQAGGDLLDDFAALGPVWVVKDWLEPGPTQLAWRVLWKLRLGGLGDRVVRAHLRRPARAIGDWPLVHVNCAGSVRLLPLLPTEPRQVIAHIHELSVGLDFHLEPASRTLLTERADRFIAVADAVADEVARYGIAPRDEIVTIHGCIDADPPPGPNPPTRAALGIPDDALVVGSSGLLHWRKAPDLFVSLARRMVDAGHPVRFVWVGGHASDPARRAAEADLARAGLADHVRFVDHQDHPRDWFRLFDVFVLPAREDAYPLVALEAAAVGLPVVCFSGGGISEFVRDDAGVVVPYPDLEAMAAAVADLAEDPARRRAMGATGRQRILDEHTPDVIAARLAREITEAWNR